MNTLDIIYWLPVAASFLVNLCTVILLARNQRRINETRQFIEQNWEYIETFRPGARAQFYAANPGFTDYKAKA